MSIGSAITARWNACGFNSSIAPIRLGDPKNPSVKPGSQNPTTGAAPEGTALPRAEFVLLDSMEEAVTANCILHEQPFFIYIRRNLADNVQLVADLKAVRLKFHNCHRAGTNPFNMGAAEDDEKVVHVKFVGSQYYPQHQNVIEGELAFSCVFTVRNSVPS